MKRLLLIDGSALLHRAFHAMPELTDRQGRPTGAVYGFVRMLVRAMTDLEPTHVMVAFDRKEPTFRKELFVGYQANRPVMDEALGTQFGTTRELLEKLEVPVLDKAGFEADDVIGTICAHAVTDEHKVDEVIVVTGDKDLMQLVNDYVKLYLPVRGISEGELVDAAGVGKKLGVRPDQVVEYKALVGDNSDNYPGVFGIGPKTAIQLLHQYGTFSGIYDHIDELKPTVKAKLEAGRDGGDLSHQLATIKRDVDVVPDWEKASAVVTKTSTWSEILSEYGFRKLAEELKGTEQAKWSEQMSLV